MRRVPTWIRGLLVLGVAAWVTTLAMPAQQPAEASPAIRYAANGELIKPADFREWVFLSSGLGMTYNPPPSGASAPAGRPLSFTNVYVNPSSYRAFMQTGAWPDQTIFILEVRSSASEGSINQGGHYQADLRAIEAEVKDASRPLAWSYYDFGRSGDRAAPLPERAPCYECHSTKAAVEQSFVQFYPTLMDVARKMGTVNAGYND